MAGDQRYSGRLGPAKSDLAIRNNRSAAKNRRSAAPDGAWNLLAAGVREAVEPAFLPVRQIHSAEAVTMQ